jgi:hypothetical protein
MSARLAIALTLGLAGSSAASTRIAALSHRCVHSPTVFAFGMFRTGSGILISPSRIFRARCCASAAAADLTCAGVAWPAMRTPITVGTLIGFLRDGCALTHAQQ